MPEIDTKMGSFCVLKSKKFFPALINTVQKQQEIHLSSPNFLASPKFSRINDGHIHPIQKNSVGDLGGMVGGGQLMVGGGQMISGTNMGGGDGDFDQGMGIYGAGVRPPSPWTCPL
jgi:hypothetical protein